MDDAIPAIHPTAIIEPGARLGHGCRIHAHAVVTRHCRLAEGVTVHAFAVLGGDPQYLGFAPATETGVVIGPGTVIREHCTINRSIHAGRDTVIGGQCLLMANAHVGHDCIVEDGVVLANNVMLAGHVAVGRGTFIGGGAGVHQFCRIGETVMIGGLSRLAQDVPPCVMAAERNEVIGLNVVGMKRRGIAREAVTELKDAYRVVYGSPGSVREAARAALSTGRFRTVEAQRFLVFFTEGRRGFARPRRAAAMTAPALDRSSGWRPRADSNG